MSIIEELYQKIGGGELFVASSTRCWQLLDKIWSAMRD